MPTSPHRDEDAAIAREVRLVLGVLLLLALVVAQFVFVPMVKALSRPEPDIRPELVGAAGAKSCAGGRP